MSTPMCITLGKYPARSTALALVALVLALAAGGCGGSGGRDDIARGSTLTIYTSLPRHGVSARAADAVASGERLALEDASGRAGGHRLRLVDLDDTAPGKGLTWDPSVVEQNAKRAAKDPSTIAYIGELDYGGSAISVPVTNGKGILQVSPGDGLTSLTRIQPGGFKTSPARYYPKGRRTFLRLVPPDVREADELLSWIRARGAGSLAIVHDDRLFGREMSAQVAAEAGSHKLRLDVVREAASDAKSYAGVVRTVAAYKPGAVAYMGIAGASAGRLLGELEAALPGVPLYGSSALTADPPSVAAGGRIDVVDPMLPARRYGPAAMRLLARLERERGGPVPVEALYGYEAMRLVLDAIDRTGRRSSDREAVAGTALTPRIRRSPIGTYSVSSTGDVSSARLATYRLEHGETEVLAYGESSRR